MNNKCKIDKSLPVIAAALMIGTPVSSIAEAAVQAEEPQTKTKSRYAIEEVTVTARKVEEGLQSAPIAISAFSAQELENRGALNITDVTSASPNVTLEDGGTASGISATPVTFIRGIGQNDFVINTDPAVGIYVDGVYFGRSLGSVIDLLDLERVEVLRGPQGTLFGRNTIGGAISLISKEPDPEQPLNGQLTASMGNNGYQLFRGTVNIPVSDNSAARFSGFSRERDGYVEALQYDDFQLGEEDVWGIKGSFKVDFTDTFSMTLSADHSDRRDSPSAKTPLDMGDLGPVDANGNAIDGIAPPPFSLFFNLGNGIPGTWLATDEGTLFNTFVTNTGELQTGRTVTCAGDVLDSSRQCNGDAWISSNPFEINSAWTDDLGNKIEPTQKLKVSGYSASFEWDAEFGTFKSTSSYREFESEFYNDFDGTPYVIVHNNHPLFEQEQWSEGNKKNVKCRAGTSRFFMFSIQKS